MLSDYDPMELASHDKQGLASSASAAKACLAALLVASAAVVLV
jgi:hypothetical protein